MNKNPRKKAPRCVVISASVIATLCGLSICLSSISSIFSPSPAEPLADVNVTNTAALETLIAVKLQTLSALTPTPQYTRTGLPSDTPRPTDTPQPLPTQTVPISNASCIPNNPPQTGKVVEVVDGDTIKVLLDQDGITYPVRYIGMDTPENTSQVEYFGAEASTKNSEMVLGKTVTLIKDVSETDKYNRLLRYVLVDDIFVNYELVAQGYANTVSYPPDITCIPTFQTAEQQARDAKLGFWTAPPTQAPVPTRASSGGDTPCSCSSNQYNCADFSSHASAQACYDYCISIGRGDVHKLDSDSDGSACESLP